MNAEDEDEDKDENKDGQPYFLQHNNDEVSTSAYKIHCTCDFFLYKMMRRIVGVLIAVGRGDVVFH
jgi:tRNA U38,U39,U40 pseudouridine synthase TruA